MKRRISKIIKGKEGRKMEELRKILVSVVVAIAVMGLASTLLASEDAEWYLELGIPGFVGDTSAGPALTDANIVVLDVAQEAPKAGSNGGNYEPHNPYGEAFAQLMETYLTWGLGFDDKTHIPGGFGTIYHPPTCPIDPETGELTTPSHGAHPGACNPENQPPTAPPTGAGSNE